VLRARCKEQNIASSGNKATLLERLRGPEVLQDAGAGAREVSPVKAGDREELCPCCGGAAAPDHQCGEEVTDVLTAIPELCTNCGESTAESLDYGYPCCREPSWDFKHHWKIYLENLSDSDDDGCG
jgi:hypothetical protein